MLTRYFDSEKRAYTTTFFLLMGLMPAASNDYFSGVRLPLSMACLQAHVIQQFLFIVPQVHSNANIYWK